MCYNPIMADVAEKTPRRYIYQGEKEVFEKLPPDLAELVSLIEKRGLEVHSFGWVGQQINLEVGLPGSDEFKPAISFNWDNTRLKATEWYAIDGGD